MTNCTNKKYELTDNYIEHAGRKLYQIRALRKFITTAFKPVFEGDLGGYIESEHNLSHEGDCWVGGNAKVFDDAIVRQDAVVKGTAVIRDNADVFGNAVVLGDAVVLGNAVVYDSAFVYDSAYVSDSACICEHSRVFDTASVSMKAKVSGRVMVYGNAHISGEAVITDSVYVYDSAFIGGRVNVGGSVRIGGLASIIGNTNLYGAFMVTAPVVFAGDAVITKPTDFLVLGPIGSRNSTTTFFINKDNKIYVSCGCFLGTIEQFETQVRLNHGGDKYEKPYLTAIALAKQQIKLY